jgi:hypothetical protein
MSKSFLITSHTEGAHPVEQRTILNGLVKSLKHYFPDCFIVLASQSNVEFETQNFADYVVVDKLTSNVPHGAGEVALINTGLDVLEQFGRHDCFKLCYDFIIDDTNYQSFDQWQSHGKEFVSCWWHNNVLGIGSWAWYATVEMQRKLFSFKDLDRFLEKKILDTITDQNLMDRCFIYETANQLLNNTWSTHGDVVHSGGNVLKHNYGKIASIVVSNERDNLSLPIVLHMIINQTKLPDRLIIFDNNTIKVDLRTIPVYNNIFTQCQQKGIAWNVVFGNQLDIAPVEDCTWSWTVDENNIPTHTELENLYRYTILNSSANYIEYNSVLRKLDK